MKQEREILTLIMADLGKEALQSGRWWFWRCPFHTGDVNPSFGVTPDNGTFYCFACGKSGNAITWLREFRKWSWRDIKIQTGLQLGDVDQNPYARHQDAGKSSVQQKSSSQRRAVSNNPQGRLMPDNSLQTAWKMVISVCQDNFWSPMGLKARSYLTSRGITETTCARSEVRLGYSPGQYISDIWVERGIVIPCFDSTSTGDVGQIHYIKIRRPIGMPKYIKLPSHGSSLSGVYGSTWLKGMKKAIVTEGEFDALLLQSFVVGKVGVFTLGSASDAFDFGRFGHLLSAINVLQVTYDNDDAGQRGADRWLKEFGRATLLPVQKPHKDLTDFWLAGGDLAEWAT